MSVTFRQLEIFIAVVETKQVTRASKKLFLTQSAVSLALGELENQLDGALFDRHGRSLLLNDRGRYLLPLAREIVSKMANVSALMNEKEGKVVGTLNLVASSTIGNYVLPYLISAFEKIHPDVIFNMRVHNTKTAEKLLVERKVDMGFVEGKVSNEQIQVTPWFMDELVLVSSPAQIGDESMACVRSGDLKKYKWVMREQGSGTAQIFKRKLGEHVTDLDVIMELGNTEAIKNALKAGSGVGCLSNLAVCHEIEDGTLKRIELDGVDLWRQLSVIQHKNKATTRLMQEFLEFCFRISHHQEAQAAMTTPENVQKRVEEVMADNPEEESWSAEEGEGV